MHPSTPSPEARFQHRDRIQSDGTWLDPIEREEISTDDVVMDLPDAGALIPRQRPMPRRRARAVLRLTWVSRRSGCVSRGRFTASFEFWEQEVDEE